MAFQKGNPKPVNSGRKKGSVNKKKVARVSELLAEKDINPTEKILELIEGGTLEPRDELKAWLELLSYTESKPKEADKPKDPDPDDDDLVDVTDSALIRIATGKTGESE